MGLKIFLPLLALHLISNLLSAQSAKDSGKPANARMSPGVSLDVGVDPAGLWGSWGPVFSVRIKGSKSIVGTEDFFGGACLEYWQYRVDEEFATGMTFVLEGSNVKRHDVSFYVTIAHRPIVIGIGATYITSDIVTLASGSMRPYNLRQWEYGGLSRFAVYLTVGLESDIALDSTYSLPIGIYYVNSSGGAERLITLRLGISRTL